MYQFTAEMWETDEWRQAVVDYPIGSIIFVKTTKQILFVKQVRPSADGPLVKTIGGAIPVGEIRLATKEEKKKAGFSD